MNDSSVTYATVTLCFVLAAVAWFGLGAVWQPLGHVSALFFTLLGGFALARVEEQRPAMVLERSKFDSGAGVLTNVTTSPDSRTGIVFLTVAVDEAGDVVATRQAADEKTARRNHKELEARVA